MTEKDNPSTENRRSFFAKMLTGTVAAAAYLSLGNTLTNAQTRSQAQVAPAKTEMSPSTLTPQQALQKLIDGNKRYAAGKVLRPDQTGERRITVSAKQEPFAIILGCSDSRVVPEIAFDEGLGDLFVVRTAGNVSDDIVLGSLEFGAAELNVPLIMVLGHQNCGAVTAVVKNAQVPGHIARIAEAIKPAVDKVRNQPGDFVDNAVRSNVQTEVGDLKQSTPILADRIKAGKLMIVGGRYDLKTGLVEVIA